MQASRCPEDGKGNEIPEHRGLRLGVMALLLQFPLLVEVPTAPFEAFEAFGASGLPVLTTVRQAHSLKQEQAALGYPVRLHVVVTYYDPPMISPRLSL